MNAVSRAAVSEAELEQAVGSEEAPTAGIAK
jgi:hypothetical protein